MKAHPFSEIFPLMSESDIQNLADDIMEHGLRDPIVTLDGQILDGRNRDLACELAGVASTYEEYTGPNALAFVISKNLPRRHLTESQRAMAAARIADLKNGSNQHSAKKHSANPENGEQKEGVPIGTPSNGSGETIKSAAKKMKVSKRSVSRAKKVLASGNAKVISEVESGEKSILAAEKEVEEKTEPAAAPDQDPVPVDAWGIPIQEHAKKAFEAVPQFEELISLLRKAKKTFNEIANLPGGKFLTLPGVSNYRRGPKDDNGEDTSRFVMPELETAMVKIKAAVPTHTVCPWHYVEAPHPEECKACYGLNWTTTLTKSADVAKERAKEAFGV